MTTDVPKFRELMRPETPYGPHLRPQVNAPSTDGQNFEEFLKRSEPVVRSTPGVDPSSERELPQRADRRNQPRPSSQDDGRIDRQDRQAHQDRQDRMDRRSDERSNSRRADDRRSDQADERQGPRSDDRRADNDRSDANRADTDKADTEAKADDVSADSSEVSDDAETSDDGLTSEVDGEQASTDTEAVVDEAAANLADDVLNLVTTLDVALYETGGDTESATPEQAATPAELEVSASQAEAMADEESVVEAAYDQAAANVVAAVPGLMSDDELTLEDEITIDVDTAGIDADGAASTDEAQSDEGNEAELDLTTEAGDESSADNSDEQAAGGSDDQATGTQVVEESGDVSSAQDAGEVLAQVATRTARVESSASQSTTSSSNTSNPVVRVDGVQATSTERTATVTAAAQNVDVGTVDGNADDPLWMQVRRAMNSLRTLENGDQQINLRLRPAELGSIMVRVAAGENQTTVSLIADSSLAATQLSQQRQLLVDELERNGMLGVSVDVGTGGGADQRSADSSSEGEGFTGNGESGAAVPGNGLSRSIDELIGANGTRRGSGASSGSLIDLDL